VRTGTARRDLAAERIAMFRLRVQQRTDGEKSQRAAVVSRPPPKIVYSCEATGLANSKPHRNSRIEEPGRHSWYSLVAVGPGQLGGLSILPQLLPATTSKVGKSFDIPNYPHLRQQKALSNE